MKKQKLSKGDYGYPAYEKKRVIIRTCIYFAISFAVYILGYLSTKTKENMLTIVAVLGLLPSCKSLVSVIMYVRIPKFSGKVYEELSGHAKSIKKLYSLYLTSYKFNFPISCFAVRDGNLIGFTEFSTCNIDECEKHIKDILSQNAIKGINIKIFKEQHRFMDRLSQLEALSPESKENEILTLLCDISL